jgi:hypothetical protein
LTLIDRIRAWYRTQRLRFVDHGELRTEGLDAAKLKAAWDANAVSCRSLDFESGRWFVPAKIDATSLADFNAGKRNIVDGLVAPSPKERGMKVGRFQVFEDKQCKFRWRLRAANGRIVASSEAYSRKYDAIRAVQAIDKALHPGYVVEIPD